MLELAGLGPGPFCAMMLADAGADVLRIDRPGPAPARPERELMNRGRRSAVLDLKHPRGPARCTRWAGRAARPSSRPTCSGDFGGGGMLMAYGICAALVERATSGRGQVVDAAIVDGVASLLAMPWMFVAQGHWRDERGVNLLDGGVPWYDVYETADSKWMAVGALEPRFYAALLAGLGLADAPDRDDPRNWPALRAGLAARFAERTQDEWAAAFAGSEACVEPVLSLHEAARDPHLASRGTYVTRDGVIQPAPAPRSFPDLRGAVPAAARAGEPHGEPLTERDLLTYCKFLLVAGTETTRNLISSGTGLLSGHPDQRRLLIGEPALLPNAVEEMLRITGVTGPAVRGESTLVAMVSGLPAVFGARARAGALPAGAAGAGG